MKIVKALFIHHSTGANLINEGDLRKLLQKKAPHIEFWDHGYSNRFNLINRLLSTFYPHIAGLSDLNGNQTEEDYNIQIKNSDPQGYEDLFVQNPNDPQSALHKVLAYDVIIFKTCFPISKIETIEKLEKYKRNYLTIRQVIDRYHQKLFILFTPPPLRPEMTKPEYAKRSRKFADWLKSEEYIGERDNLAIFDFFDLLADKSNKLKRGYCKFLPFDSHPNKQANEEITPFFVDLIVKQVNANFG